MTKSTKVSSAGKAKSSSTSSKEQQHDLEESHFQKALLLAVLDRKNEIDWKNVVLAKGRSEKGRMHRIDKMRKKIKQGGNQGTSTMSGSLKRKAVVEKKEDGENDVVGGTKSVKTTNGGVTGKD